MDRLKWEDKMLMWEKEGDKKMTVNYHDCAPWRVEWKGVLDKNVNIFIGAGYVMNYLASLTF